MPDTSWIGSLNIDSFVTQQMQREQINIQQNAQPKISQLTTSQTTLKNQLSVYQQLQGLVPAFQATLTQLSAAFNPSYQVGYSTAGIATATINGTPAPGSHSLSVTQLAQAQSIESGGSAFTSSTNALGLTETIGFTFGSGSFNVNVASGDSLQSVATNINNTAQINGYGITASVVSTSSGNYQLIISANQSGASNQFSVSETPSAGLNITTGVGGTAVVLQSAADAQFKLDGVSYDQPSNTNSIAGMNLTLLSLGSTNINLSTSYQTSSIITAAQNMVTAYNQILTTAETSQIQNGIDPNLTLLLSSLQTQMNSVYNGAGAFAGKGLGTIGIGANSVPQTVQITMPNGNTTTSYLTGLLQLDTSTLPADTTSLANVLNSNLTDAKSMLFDSTNGIMTLMSQNILNPGIGSADQAINNTKSGGLITAQNQLATVTQQLTTENQTVTDAIQALKLKYAQLDVTLQTMQNASNFIYAQMQVMGAGH